MRRRSSSRASTSRSTERLSVAAWAREDATANGVPKTTSSTSALTAGVGPASPPDVRTHTGAATAALTAGTASHRSWRRRSTLAPLALLTRAAAAIRALVVTSTQATPRSDRRNPAAASTPTGLTTKEYSPSSGPGVRACKSREQHQIDGGP